MTSEKVRENLVRRQTAPKPLPRSLPVSVEDFNFAPRATGRWLGMRISNRAIREVVAGLTQALADHPTTINPAATAAVPATAAGSSAAWC